MTKSQLIFLVFMTQEVRQGCNKPRVDEMQIGWHMLEVASFCAFASSRQCENYWSARNPLSKVSKSS